MERRWNRLIRVFLERRLRIEEVDLAGTAFHEAPDHRLGTRRDVRRLRRERIDGRGEQVFSSIDARAMAAKPLPACPKNSRLVETCSDV
jgi:hypothetical protein